MDLQDLAYLQAELAQAQQQGTKMLLVRTSELQSLLQGFRHLSQLPKQPVKVLGFARSGEIQMFKHAKLMTMRVRRLPNKWTDQAVYVDPKGVTYEPVLPVE